MDKENEKIPSIPEFDPNINELRQGVTINEKGEIIREGNQEQLSNIGKEEITEIALNQREGKFKRFAQRIKMALNRNPEQRAK